MRLNGKWQIDGMTERKAFTLIEILVVIAVIALLMAILLPVLARAKESARRCVCRSHLRQFILGIHLYANDNKERLPSGLSDNRNPRDEHTPILSRAVRNALVDVIGSDGPLMCPWLRKPFTDPDGWYYSDHGGYGYVIGYNYLGGHQGTPWPLLGLANAEWKSPQSTADDSSIPIVTELNAWTTGGNWTFAPHGHRGPILQAGDSTNPAARGIPSEQIGAVGGNVGLLDGSASWKKIADMKIYRGSHLHARSGCFAAW